MATSTNETAAAVDVKAALEAFAGHAIDASEQQIQEQLIHFAVPFSTYSFTPAGTGTEKADNIGQVVTRNIIVVGSPSCSTSELLDVSGVNATSDTGNLTLLVKDFLCPDEPGRVYNEPVNIVATAVSANPFILTVTHSLISSPTPNVQINIFSWDFNGAPAPNVVVNWRCRVPTFPLIF